MIGYYAHHHGTGHMTRATSIAAATDEHVTVLSSRQPFPHSDIEWLQLPLDTPQPSDTGDPEYPADETAGGILHWAPTGVRGLTDRMALIAEWVARVRPRLVVVDVSVEVTLLVRLLGVDVVVMAMPGERTDTPHTLAYRAASAIVAPWSRSVYDPQWLRPYADKTTYVGAISRFDGRARETVGSDASVVVLGGAGGTTLVASDIELAGAANPEFRWIAAGIDASSWRADVWPLLCSATVVVTHAGQNALADVAAAGSPAIVIPQDRPFDEQIASARALGSASVAVVTDAWPDPDGWTALLNRATELGASGWDRVEQRGAAGRAARVLDAGAVVR